MEHSIGEMMIGPTTPAQGSKDNSLQEVELSGNSDMKIVVNSTLQRVSSTVFLIRVSFQRLS